MRKRIFTLLMGILAFTLVNAQTVVFDPATFTGEMPSGMSIVEVEGTKYLQVVVDGWNSTLNVPEITTLLGTQMSGTVKYSQCSSTIAAGLSLDKIASVVQIMDTINRVPASWNPSQLIPAATSLTQNPTLEGWSFRQVGITPEMKNVHQIQFFGQKQTDWNPTVGDTMWVSQIVTVDANAIFDPATVDPSTLPSGMTIVEVDGEKLLKVVLNDWNSNLPIDNFPVGRNNKMTFKVKYEAGTSGIANADAQTIVKAYGATGDLFNGTSNPAPSELTEVITDAKPESIVTGILFAAQQKTGTWPAITDAVMYVSKISVYYKGLEPVVAPNTATLAFSAEAKNISVDGLYDDQYGDAVNVINRVALNETGGTISEDNSYGEWLAVADMKNFYFYIEVNDDDPFELENSTQPWSNDGIEIFMDIQNRRYVGSARISGEQHQFRINYGTEGPAHGDGGDGVSFGMDAFFGNNDTTNIEFAIMPTTAGYVIEARIPWATWYRKNSNNSQDALDAINLKENMKVAFEVSILDADAPDARKSILNWANNTNTDVAYTTNQYYGEITLKGGWPVGIVTKEAVEALNVYPNPASNLINIEMENAQSAQIYNVLGAKVASINLNGENTIDISNLQMGIYVLYVKDNNGKMAVAKFNKN